MRLDANVVARMPEQLKALFNKLPNPGSDEVLAAFPESKDGIAVGRNRDGSAHSGNTIFGARNAHTADAGYGSSGSAARYFYCAKASKKDRDAGLGELPEVRTGGMQATADGSMLTGSGNERTTTRANTHPTVKPTALMRYLCRLVTPPGGTVLDPFAGSGSTGRGAVLEGFDFIGIEQDEAYAKIARLRIADAQREARREAKTPKQLGLLDKLVNVARNIHAISDGDDVTLTVRRPKKAKLAA